MLKVSKKKENLVQRVAFRLPIDKFEKINSILQNSDYKNQSNFFRGAVDLLLFWENELDVDEVTDPSLQKSIRDRFSKVEKVEKGFPEIRAKIKKRYELMKKAEVGLEEMIEKKEKFLEKVDKKRKEDQNFVKKFAPGLKEYEKETKEAGMGMVLFIIQLIRNLYSQFEKKETPLNIKEWETQILADAKKLFDEITTEEKKKTSKSNLKRNTVTKGLTAKDFFNTVNASQFKKEGKKEKKEEY